MDNEQEKEEKEESKEPDKNLPDEEEILEKQADKKQNKLFIITIIIIIVTLAVLFSIRFFFGGEKYPSYTYNGFEFTKIVGLWHTDWQSGDTLYKIHLRFGPRESEDVPMYEVENADFNFSNRTTYLTFDPGYKKAYVALASSEIALSLTRVFGIVPIAACSKNETKACSIRPIITCYNTEENETAVIYIKEADENMILLEGNCLIIQGRGEDIVKAADKMIWIWYGILK